MDKISTGHRVGRQKQTKAVGKVKLWMMIKSCLFSGGVSCEGWGFPLAMSWHGFIHIDLFRFIYSHIVYITSILGFGYTTKLNSDNVIVGNVLANCQSFRK